MGAGWDERYQFFVSGKYNHRPSQMVCDSSDRGDSGHWKINNDNSIELNIVQKIFVDEKQITPDDFGGCGTPNIINKVSLDKIVIVDECAGVKSNPESLTCMILDGVEYYRMSKDPKNNMDSELDNEPNLSVTSTQQEIIKDGNHFVFVKDIYSNEGNLYMVFDKIELINGGHRISNTNPLLRTLPIAEDTNIELDSNSGSGLELKKFTTDELWQYIQKYTILEKEGKYVDHKTLYTDFLHRDETILITVKNGIVTEIRFWWFAG